MQKRGGLAAIAEGGHVYSLKRGLRDIAKNNGQVDMAKMGVSRASTFPGYCNHHDTTLFRPVERTGSILDVSNCFLLSLRAVTYELATKAASLAAHQGNRDTVDRGMPFAKQVQLQSILHLHGVGMRKGLDDVMANKALYDQTYRSQDFQKFNVCGVTFDVELPFVAAGAFMPQFDFGGKQIQVLTDPEITSQIAVNVTRLDGKSCVVLGWFGDAGCPAARLVDSFETLADDEKGDAVLALALEYLENVYFRPSWWEALPADISERLHKRIAHGMPGRPHEAMDLMERGARVIHCSVAGSVRQRAV
ncbi:hypothetical protein ASF45_27885 [Pseudorhodoferax sp. Leaf265]|nr:hypothetical protein ASF45_27885 [Pseudorhodoferax sp. Leaf265]